jgi:hypothetical protein
VSGRESRELDSREPMKMLPGPSSYELSRRGLMVFAFVLGFGLVGVLLNVGSQVLPYWAQVAFWVVFGLLAASLGLLGWLSVRARTRARGEALRGYTTALSDRQALPQSDPATGRVIRRAGAPYLTRREFRSARTRT